VVLAGLMAAVPLTKRKLREHTFVFYGAGSAGVGIANLIAHTQCVEDKISMEEARKNIWLVDSQGLICKNRSGLNGEKEPFAHLQKECKELAEVVKQVKATALIGVCAIPQTFDEKVCKQMAANCESPLIFALSNPTSKAECTAEQAYKWTNGKAVFASGSPFDPVTMNGKLHVPGQGNNSYIFPGLALGVIATCSRRVTDSMFYVAAKALARQVTAGDLAQGCLYPPLRDVRHISARIAADVAAEAYSAKLATVQPQPKDLLQFMYDNMYTATYDMYA